MSTGKKATIRIEFIGPFRDITGERRTEIETPATRDLKLRDVLNLLSKKYGKKFLDRAHGSAHKIGETTMILVNKTIVMDEAGLDRTPVPTGSKIVFMIPLSGG